MDFYDLTYICDTTRVDPLSSCPCSLSITNVSFSGQDGILPGGHGVQGEGKAVAHQQRDICHILLSRFCHGPLGGGLLEYIPSCFAIDIKSYSLKGDGHCEECWELNNANDG